MCKGRNFSRVLTKREQNLCDIQLNYVDFFEFFIRNLVFGDLESSPLNCLIFTGDVFIG